MRRFVTFVLIPLLAGAICLLIGLNLRARVATENLNGLSTSKLQDEKLRQEIQQLQLSNSENVEILHELLAWAPFVTALAAIAAVGATLWKQASELEAARTRLEEEQSKVRTANEEEALRRFDTNLANVIANLGSGSEVLRVNAAAALATYIKARYSAFYTDILIVLSSNLRLQPTEPVARVLREDLERLLRLIFDETVPRAKDLPTELDLGRASLSRFDISGINFGEIVLDVAFADLSEARLADAKLFRLRGREVNLENSYCSRAILGEARLNNIRARGAIMHSTNLVSATLKDSDLRDVKFQGAFMQEAHLEGAQLEGANFTGANLANTFFQGATFDRAALRTIALGAQRWRDNRNLDDYTRRALLDLGNGRE